MMDKAKLEYIWLDGYEPTQNMRSKTMVRSDFSGDLEDCPEWMFDGSSTRQAEGGSSDCLLKPVAIFPDPQRINGYLVMCEVLNADGTPHPSNGRATIDDDDDDFWFGYEQEYFIMDVDTQLLSVSQLVAIQALKDSTTAPSVEETLTAVRLSKSTQIFASRQESILKESIKKWPAANGNSKFSQKVRSALVTNYGSPAISSID